MFSKTSQLTKTEITKKVCEDCKVTRDLKFFSSKRAKTCGDCKRKKWNKAFRERPAAVNKKADTAWAKAVKVRDGFECLYCHTPDHLNSHHIFSRKNEGLRWDLDNGVTLCAKHHTFSNEFSAHRTPTEFVEFIKELKGIEWYERLRSKAKKVYKENDQ